MFYRDLIFMLTLKTLINSILFTFYLFQFYLSFKIADSPAKLIISTNKYINIILKLWSLNT